MSFQAPWGGRGSFRACIVRSGGQGCWWLPHWGCLGACRRGVLVFSGIVVFGVPPIFFCFVGGLASLTAGGWYRGARGGLRSAFGARYGGLRGW